MSLHATNGDTKKDNVLDYSMRRSHVIKYSSMDSKIVITTYAYDIVFAIQQCAA